MGHFGGSPKSGLPFWGPSIRDKELNALVSMLGPLFTETNYHLPAYTS